MTALLQRSPVPSGPSSGSLKGPGFQHGLPPRLLIPSPVCRDPSRSCPDHFPVLQQGAQVGDLAKSPSILQHCFGGHHSRQSAEVRSV